MTRARGNLIHRTLVMARWRLHSFWAKSKVPRPISARLETIATNGMFRDPIQPRPA